MTRTDRHHRDQRRGALLHPEHRSPYLATIRSARAAVLALRYPAGTPVRVLPPRSFSCHQNCTPQPRDAHDGFEGTWIVVRTLASSTGPGDLLLVRPPASGILTHVPDASDWEVCICLTRIEGASEAAAHR